MITAVNAPFKYPEFNQGTYLYGLAHEAIKNEEYRTFLRDGAKDRYTIFDNGADELGEGMQGEEYYDLIRDINPQEVICPDVLKDPEETLKRSDKFMEEVKEDEFLRDRKFMMVAQGTDFYEYRDNFLVLNNERPDIDVIGIPYDIDFTVPWVKEDDEFQSLHKSRQRGMRRVKLIQFILRMGYETNTPLKPIHLLGFNNLAEIKFYRDYVNLLPEGQRHVLRSNDTTAPFAAGSEKKTWNDHPTLPKDWEALDFEIEWDNRQKRAAYLNCLDYFNACGDFEASERLRRLG